MWHLIQTSTENDYIDFKRQWYPKDSKGDFSMIHDILSLSNSLSDSPERFIFIGVNNDKTLFDLSGDINKRTSEDIVQKLRNFLSVPPLIEVFTETIDNKQIDCIRITVRNRDLPYMTHSVVEYEDEKAKKHRIPKYAILSRTSSRNDGAFEYASKEVVEELFARKKGEHLPILERFAQYLEDINNWKMVRSGNQITYYYTKNHTFKIIRTEDFSNSVTYTNKVPNYAYLLDFSICEDYWKYHQKDGGATYDDSFCWFTAELWADNTILETYDLASIYLKYYFVDRLQGFNLLYSDFYLPNRFDLLKQKHTSSNITSDELKTLISDSLQFKICHMMQHLDHEVPQAYEYETYLDCINYEDLLNTDYRKNNEAFVYEQNINLKNI